MANEQEQPSRDERTIPSASAMVAKEIRSPLGNVPWTLQQFFKGQIDLDAELVQRFPTMPLMSVIKFRELGSSSERGVATLTTQDGSAILVVDVNAGSNEIHLSFTYGSMLTLRFRLDDLSDMDRARWLELMRRKQGGLAFLWGQARWNNDYAICVLRKYYTSLLAFSPQNFEAAVRISPDANKKLLDWLERFWHPKQQEEEAPAKEPPPVAEPEDESDSSSSSVIDDW